MISLSTFSYDEMSKSNKYILTLPANRKKLVTEKYILAIGATILGGISRDVNNYNSCKYYELYKTQKYNKP